MIDALLRAVLTQVDYETPQPGEPPPDPLHNDVDCNLWSGLLEFSVVENGSYPAAVPFISLGLPFGGTISPDILTYDGLGGWCEGGSLPATCKVRVTVSGLDSLGYPVFGSTVVTLLHPGTATPHPPPIPYLIKVDVNNPIRRKRARLWFLFAIGTMC